MLNHFLDKVIFDKILTLYSRKNFLNIYLKTQQNRHKNNLAIFVLKWE
jgi:hypothetical protein